MTNTQTSVPADRAVGSIYGLAFGDAIGDPVEFRKYPAIVAMGGASVPDRLRVTDDTQMSLGVWYAIDAWDPAASLGMLRMDLAVEFLSWLHDSDNNRAPGTTCLSALHALERNGLGRWTVSTSAKSAGCGSVMRAPWVGLHPKVRDEDVAPVAMLQAVLTHAPAENAFCAAALAELTRAIATDEVRPGEAAQFLADWARFAEGMEYDTAALSDVWRHARTTTTRPGVAYDSEDAYVAEGIEHVAWVAEAAQALAGRLRQDFWDFDPCSVAGQGWRAREAMAVAVGIFDGLAPALAEVDEPGGVQAVSDRDLAQEALLRAAETNGDSDSIGAITGALVGAAFGDVFPTSWKVRLEQRYRDELGRVSLRLS